MCLTAYNTLGTGIDITSEPALVQPAIQTPMIPQNVQVTVRTSSSIVVSWQQPVSTGGNSIDYYRVEWDIVESFNSVCNGDCKVVIPLGSSNAGTGILNFTITDLTPGFATLFVCYRRPVLVLAPHKTLCRTL